MIGGIHMLANLLWIINANYQYQRQKALGLAGFIGILLVIFMFWKWDSLFYPVLNQLGLVGFAERVGLISDNPLFTTFNIVYLLFMLCLFFALGSFVLTILGAVFMIFGQSKIGKYMFGIALAILLSPILIPYLFVLQARATKSQVNNRSLQYTYLNDPELLPIYNEVYKNEKTQREMFYLYERQMGRELNLPYHDLYDQLKRDLIEDESSSLSRAIRSLSDETAIQELNRAVASIKDDSRFLTGYCNDEKQWFILFPNPLPAYYSKCVDYDRFRPFNGFLKFEDGILSNGLMVPALPFQYVWNEDELRIEPKVVDNASLKSINIANVMIRDVKTDEMVRVNKEVAQRQDVYDWVYAAHITYHLIPIAYGRTKASLYMQEAQEVPYTDIYAPIYSSGVQEAILDLKSQGRPWAVEWVSNHFIRESFHEGTNFG